MIILIVLAVFGFIYEIWPLKKVESVCSIWAVKPTHDGPIEESLSINTRKICLLLGNLQHKLASRKVPEQDQILRRAVKPDDVPPIKWKFISQEYLGGSRSGDDECKSCWRKGNTSCLFETLLRCMEHGENCSPLFTLVLPNVTA